MRDSLESVFAAYPPPPALKRTPRSRKPFRMPKSSTFLQSVVKRAIPVPKAKKWPPRNAEERRSAFLVFIGVHRRPFVFGAHLPAVHPRTRLSAGGLPHRGRVEDPLIHGQHFVNRRVGFPREQVAQGGSRGIVEIQRRDPEQPEYGLQQAGKAGVSVADVVRLDPRPQGPQDR